MSLGTAKEETADRIKILSQLALSKLNYLYFPKRILRFLPLYLCTHCSSFLERPSVCQTVTKWCVVDLAAHQSKANKQAGLVEKKVCFISDASN